MKLYIGVNEDGSEIISKQPLKRFFNYEENRNDVLSYKAIQKNNHWILDYSNVSVPKTGDVPIDKYLSLPCGSIEKMFGVSMSWNDDAKIIEL